MAVSIRVASLAGSKSATGTTVGNLGSLSYVGPCYISTHPTMGPICLLICTVQWMSYRSMGSLMMFKLIMNYRLDWSGRKKHSWYKRRDLYWPQWVGLINASIYPNRIAIINNCPKFKRWLFIFVLVVMELYSPRQNSEWAVPRILRPMPFFMISAKDK